MNSKTKAFFTIVLASLTATTLPVWAATQAELRVAVYSSGFLVDTQRQVTHSGGSRRVQVKSQAKGTAVGETQEAAVQIDRVDKGLQWHMNPRAKTYSEVPYEPSYGDDVAPPVDTARGPVTLKVSKIEPTISGPLGSATINGLPCQSYTIRVVADFADPQTGKVIATETLLEKLWVTEKAPLIEKFKKAESNFQNAKSESYGSEKASFRWLLREFNQHILEMNGNPEDFKALQATYRGARNSIKGTTVRQLVGWNWWPKDESAPGASTADDMNVFLASIAAGLGAPPDVEGKTPLKESEKPTWVQELEKDLGRTGPTAMLLEEILSAKTVKADPKLFEVPETYRRL